MADGAETPIKESTVGDSKELPDNEPSDRQEKGIDVSKRQGTINWADVAAAGVKHAYIKISEGASFVDEKFLENWIGASTVGIKVNCYHYFRALDCTPEQQFENIKKITETIEFDPARNCLAIDVEEKGNENATPAQMADNLNTLLELIKKDSVLSRKATMIYTSVKYWDSKVEFNRYNFSEYPLWVAHWRVKTPKLPASWRNAKKSWVWWQYSATGEVDGIAGNVDLDWVKA